MGDLIIMCWRGGQVRPGAERALARLACRLRPDNIVARATRFVAAPGIAAAVVNPSPDGVRIQAGALALGAFIGSSGAWSRPGGAHPDGAYCLTRWDADRLELVADAAASRTLWYALGPRELLASTSQRALVALLGAFRLDPEAVSWMVSSGTLGPSCSWDSRIKRLPPHAELVLDRRSWKGRLARQPTVFSPVERPHVGHLAVLRHAINTSCGALEIDDDRWVLPLSGGSDSRAILAFMAAHGRRLQCVTWTTRASARTPFSDASVARLVARRFRMPHEFLYLDGTEVHPATALRRFIELGEGRSDKLSGYVDGCRVWQQLFDQGASGVIRGDEAFGGRHLAASMNGARRVGAELGMLQDHEPDSLVRRLGLQEQRWPAALRRGEHETLETYRDRMSHDGYLPAMLAALNEIKARYVEIVNPLLSWRILATVRTLPDAERMYGRAFLRLMAREVRGIPYARYSSTPRISALLSSPEVQALMAEELGAARVERVVSREGAGLVLAAMGGTRAATLRERSVAAMRAGRDALPTSLALRLTPRFEGPEPLSADRVAFRIMIASKTVALFEEDAGWLTRGE